MKQLNVLSSGEFFKGTATIMDNIDLPKMINEVIVVEGTVRVEYEVLDIRVRLIVPLDGLVDEAPAVNENQASHLILQSAMI